VIAAAAQKHQPQTKIAVPPPTATSRGSSDSSCTCKVGGLNGG
jgi:hypothetical protein